MRKPIFDVIRAQRGKGFSGEEIAAVDALLDQLGVERDDAAAPQAPPQAAAPPGAADGPGLNDPQAFFDSVRASGLLGGAALKPDQLTGLGAVLGAAQKAGWPLAFTAYALATACHETAYTMQPVREAFWLSEAWRRTHLRYYPYYGRGYVQLTWEDNYKRADLELGLGGKLLADLDVALDPAVAAGVMAKGMTEGWFAGDKVGRHTLARHLPGNGPANLAQFTAARRIINGTDQNTKIAGEAQKFQAALQAGGW